MMSKRPSSSPLPIALTSRVMSLRCVRVCVCVGVGVGVCVCVWVGVLCVKASYLM